MTPSSITQIINSNKDEPFNSFKYTLAFTPKVYIDIETTREAAPKRIGKIRATFTDANGKTRISEKNLGSIIVNMVALASKDVIPSQNLTSSDFNSSKNDLNQNKTSEIPKIEKDSSPSAFLVPLLGCCYSHISCNMCFSFI